MSSGGSGILILLYQLKSIFKKEIDFVPDSNKKILKAAWLLTRDARKVERKKPGKKKARKSPSWSKR